MTPAHPEALQVEHEDDLASFRMWGVVFAAGSVLSGVIAWWMV